MTSSSDPPGPVRDGEPAVDAVPDVAARAQKAKGASPRVVTSDSLLAGAAELAILHNETMYFLRQTRLGKLILTK